MLNIKLPPSRLPYTTLTIFLLTSGGRAVVAAALIAIFHVYLRYCGKMSICMFWHRLGTKVSVFSLGLLDFGKNHNHTLVNTEIKIISHGYSLTLETSSIYCT